MPALTPKDGVTWAKEIDEIKREMASKNLFFIKYVEPDFRAVLFLRRKKM
jgi:hypothetical protein